MSLSLILVSAWLHHKLHQNLTTHHNLNRVFNRLAALDAKVSFGGTIYFDEKSANRRSAGRIQCLMSIIIDSLRLGEIGHMHGFSVIRPCDDAPICSWPSDSSSAPTLSVVSPPVYGSPLGPTLLCCVLQAG